jgi:hypothetical protein
MSSIKDYAAVRRLAIIGQGFLKSEPEPGDGGSTLADSSIRPGSRITTTSYLADRAISSQGIGSESLRFLYGSILYVLHRMHPRRSGLNEAVRLVSGGDSGGGMTRVGGDKAFCPQRVDGGS